MIGCAAVQPNLPAPIQRASLPAPPAGGSIFPGTTVHWEQEGPLSPAGPLDKPPEKPSREGAQEEGILDVELEEMVVTAEGKHPMDVILPQARTLLAEKSILRQNTLTVPDALEGEVGVTIQKTNLGGGSPIVRGRTGKEVLLLLDGQRFNNSTFRENNQYLNTIDLNAVDQIELVRGPASVTYGSDAMGGSLNVITRRRELTGERGLGGRLFQKFESADKGVSTHVALEGEWKDFGFTGGFTYKRFDDLRAGSHGDPAGAVDQHGRQVPTGFRERALSFSLIRRLNETDTIDLLLLHTHQEDVPRSDRLIPNRKQPDPPDLLWEYDPQILRWYELRYCHKNPGETLESLTLTASLNNPSEGRQRIKASKPGILLLEDDEVTAPGLSARVGILPCTGHFLTAGIEGFFEVVDSDAETVDLETGRVTREKYGRHPDGATFQHYGAYLQDEWRLAEGLRWINGLRFSAVHVNLDFEGLQVGSLPPFGKLSETYDDLTFSTSLVADIGESATLYGTLSRGFRAPNLHDLATFGDFAAGNRIPNLDLEPETVLNLEIGADHRTPSLHAGAAGAVAFYRDIFDTRFAFTFEGEDFFQIENASKAVIYSVEGWIKALLIQPAGPFPEHVVYAQGFWNVGRNVSDGEPLSKVPPPEITVGYRLEEAKDSWFAEVFLRSGFKQHRLSSADKADPRIPEGGTPAWWTFNLRGGAEIGKNLRLTLSLENLFDQRYRIHGSGIDAPGFNAILSLDWRF